MGNYGVHEPSHRVMEGDIQVMEATARRFEQERETRAAAARTMPARGQQPATQTVPGVNDFNRESWLKRFYETE